MSRPRNLPGCYRCGGPAHSEVSWARYPGPAEPLCEAHAAAYRELVASHIATVRRLPREGTR